MRRVSTFLGVIRPATRLRHATSPLLSRRQFAGGNEDGFQRVRTLRLQTTSR
ncbi:hypothetical protein HSB1_36980 [Halogranum salarium B-1]|uniref:Uncharacterized protein n=1 Tax=Halogranum salarium B-1 TaxID=1210908 RepID=J3JED9_9EURY|nr:hypothetical protein HSB1_36980 [Halogranum salarium B-1]